MCKAGVARNYTNYAVSAARILIKNALGILSSIEYKTSDIIDAKREFHAILRNRSILVAIGGKSH